MTSIHQSTVQQLKCIIWDLDDTIWTGILAEDPTVHLVESIKMAIQLFDSKGILNSIASRNDYAQAKKQLIQLGLWDYFVYPQINWNDKADSILTIMHSLGFQPIAFLFIDDQAFERARIHYQLPEMPCIDPKDVADLVKKVNLCLHDQTTEAAHRRLFYQQDQQRKQIEQLHSDNYEEFLSLSKQQITIQKALSDDLQRAKELTERTHQLNTTGYTYSYEELEVFSQSTEYDLYVIKFKDKFGDYGNVGLVLIEKGNSSWLIKLFILSCRVLSRNITNIIIKYLIKAAQEKKLDLLAEFIDTDLNRKMYIAYKFNGFDEIKRDEKKSILKFNTQYPIPELPRCIEILSIEK